MSQPAVLKTKLKAEEREIQLAGRPAVRKQMPTWELLAGLTLLVLGLAFFARAFTGSIRFVLLTAWMVGAGVVLAFKTNFACPR
ncbi:MAG: hypothetical protein C4551_02780 [Bacillota bacterium]|jgi:hypothetical protein|nr:MAG: hypothetical protein C4551_02780 [Bacillota bacterium]